MDTWETEVNEVVESIKKCQKNQERTVTFQKTGFTITKEFDTQSKVFLGHSYKKIFPDGVSVTIQETIQDRCKPFLILPDGIIAEVIVEKEGKIIMNEKIEWVEKPIS